MTKRNWEKARKLSRQRKAGAASDSCFYGVKPCTSKQYKFLCTLTRKLGLKPDEFIREFQGHSNTLSARKASQAITAALTRIGGS